ncbi:hypothetical protein A9K55_006439 [Cordyceps militaris]|uniref:Uncharacterized protein n=1 Tax=Cordyceps militaris TaxID=73501 RepID=A0A2H4SCT3_CORMI|nr:hypothetical protein A9K55_006439 [Cordyceps militaris]
MQLQSLLLSLVLGLAAAAPQAANQSPGDDNGCDQGSPLPGQDGTLCVGTHGENFGPAKAVAPPAAPGSTAGSDAASWA